MTRRTRTILFLSLAAAFLFAVPSLILYSQGYRIDWKTKRITQTGALYFKVTPPRADIFINEKLFKTTDFFFGSALVGNLLPGSYQVQIAKEGYQPWSKQLEIKEAGVTDAKNIILFPQNPEFRTLTDHIQQAWKTPQEKILLLQRNTPEKTWKLVLFNVETTGEETIFTQKSKEQIWNVQWSSDGTRVLLSVVSGESMRSLVLSLKGDQACNPVPCDLAFLGESIDTVMFSPISKDQVIFAKFLRNAQIFREADYVKKEVLAPFGNNVVTFTVAAESLLWLESDGKLWQKDTGSQNPAQILSSLSYPVKQETEYSIHVTEHMIFLKEDTKLLQVQQQEHTFREVFSGVKTIVPSPDGKKLALSNDSEIWILYLQNSLDQPFHTTGDKVFLTRLSKNIKNLSWLSSHYLVFSSENEVKTIEIDERSTVNIVDLAQFPDPALRLRSGQESQNALVVLSQGNVYISEKLIQ